MQYAAEAEQSVIGSMLIAPDCVLRSSSYSIRRLLLPRIKSSTKPSSICSWAAPPTRSPSRVPQGYWRVRCRRRTAYLRQLVEITRPPPVLDYAALDKAFMRALAAVACQIYMVAAGVEARRYAREFRRMICELRRGRESRDLRISKRPASVASSLEEMYRTRDSSGIPTGIDASTISSPAQ